MSDLQATTELCRLLGDPTRVRLLSLLASEELTVAELTEVTGLGQSRVSTHLGLLREAGLLVARRAGASTFYRLHEAMPDEASRMWAALQPLADPLLDQDLLRARSVVASRHGDEPWADTVAGRMARHYSPGRTWESAARGIAGLVRIGRLLDVASGDGALAELLAPRASSVTCLDASDKVVAVGKERLKHVSNLSFVQGDMHDLPFPAGSFDAALLMSALDYAADPDKVLEEVARVLAPGGAVVGATLGAHRHEGIVAAYNHVQLGFEPNALRSRLKAAGFRVDLCATTSRERRPPHFEVVTFHAVRG